MKIVPIRDLKDTVKIESLCDAENGPVFITKNGYGRLVVMDIDYYEKTMQKMFDAKNIQSGVKDMENGKVIEGETVIGSMREKYGL